MKHLRPILPILLLLASRSLAAPLSLTDSGKSPYTIVLPANADPGTKHAADELQKFLKEITGATLPITTEETPAQLHEILLGQSARVKDLAKELEPLGDEGYLLRTTGERIILAGNTGRANLYAVYALLNDHLGCRWFTPTVSRIPHAPTLTLDPIDEKKIPALEYREVMSFDAWNADWMARNRLNTTKLLDAARGSAVKYVPEYYVHTFSKFLPPDAYFKDHPEYFAEVDGKRVTDQLCPTNEQAAAIVTERVRKLFRDNPDCRIISISQNDNDRFCHCPACAALDEKEGSHAAQLLHLVNGVAQAIEKEFPDRAIETLAYQWSRQPPKTIKPRANVIIRLSTIKCSFSEPIEKSNNAANRAFRKDLEAWAKISDRLWVWDYMTNFSYYPLPFPNQHVIGENLHYFAGQHVRGVVEQANWQSPGAGLAPLDNYLAACLLWNPGDDAKKRTQEFLETVYGPAANPIQRYIDLLTSEVETKKIAMPIYGSRTPAYLSREILEQSDKLWDEAEAAVKDHPDLLARVELARLSHDYAYIEHWRFKPNEMVHYDGDPKRSKVTRIEPAYEAHIQRFLKTAAAAKITHIREGAPDYPTLEKYLNSLIPQQKP